jgi:sugar O-acyltransferase (sialic acid O-acetyltransferase NeuD family)
MKKIVIFGSGSLAKTVFYELKSFPNYKVVGFCDDKFKFNKVINLQFNLKNTEKSGDIFVKSNSNVGGIVAVGENKLRKKIVEECNHLNKNFKWISLVSKKTIIGYNVNIGEGSIILPGTFLGNNVKIEKHCIVNSSCSIDHDSILSNYSSFGPGVITGGNVLVGQLSFIGIGSTIKHAIKIEENVFIGGHSYVNKNCEKNCLYFGNPIKKIKKNLKKQSQF